MATAATPDSSQQAPPANPIDDVGRLDWRQKFTREWLLTHLAEKGMNIAHNQRIRDYQFRAANFAVTGDPQTLIDAAADEAMNLSIGNQYYYGAPPADATDQPSTSTPTAAKPDAPPPVAPVVPPVAPAIAAAAAAPSIWSKLALPAAFAATGLLSGGTALAVPWWLGAFNKPTPAVVQPPTPITIPNGQVEGLNVRAVDNP